MTFRVSLVIDGNAKGAADALKQVEAGFEGIERAASMGGPATKGYTETLSAAYGMTERLSSAQVKIVRQIEDMVARQQLTGAELSTYNALRISGTVADSQAATVIAALVHEYHALASAAEQSAAAAQQAGVAFRQDLEARLGISDAVGKSARDSAAAFEQELRAVETIATQKAQQAGANFTGALESRLGIADVVRKSAADSARVFEQEFKRIETIAATRARAAGEVFQSELNRRLGIGGPSAQQMGASFSALAEREKQQAERAKVSAAVAQARFNEALGIDRVAKSARESAAAFGELDNAQQRTERSSSNLANSLTRRFVLGYVVSQARAAAAAILNLNSELAKVGDTAARTGVSAANLQGFQTAAAYKGIGGTQFLDSMLAFNQQVAHAQHGVGELYLLLRANGMAAKGVEDAFEKVADLVRNARSEADKFDILRQAGLPASREFVKLMEQGAAAIKEQADQSEKFSEEQLRAAKKIEESFNKLWVDFSRGAKKAVLDTGGFLDELAVKAREAVLWGEKAGSAAARSVGLGLVKNRLGSAFGAADASAFYDAVGVGLPSSTSSQGKTKNPALDKLELQRDIQNLSILGQLITATEARTLAEKQLDLAVANGASIDKTRRNILIGLAYQRALGIDQIRASADMHRLEAETVGMATGAAEAHRAAHAKINEERRKGNDLRPNEIAQIQREAAALGEAAQRTEDLRWGYENFARGPLQTLRSEIAAGKTGFEALRAAGAKALESITVKLTDMASRDLWNAAFGGAKGSGGFSLAALLPGGGRGSAAPTSTYMMGGTTVPVFHSGRQPGVPPREWRSIDPQVFAAAPRFHTGKSPWFAAGELPAIIKDDEWIIPDDKVRRAGRGGGGGDSYYDNRTFHDVTPDVMARFEARMRQEKPLWIKDALRAMQSQRSVNPHAYSPGGGS